MTVKDNPPPTAPPFELSSTTAATTATAAAVGEPEYVVVQETTHVVPANIVQTVSPPPAPAPQTCPVAAPTKTTPPAPGPLINVGRRPFRTVCPYCRQEMVTRTNETMSVVTIVAVIALLILFWPLFWLPFCMPACKSVVHTCTNCNRRIAVQEPCT